VSRFLLIDDDPAVTSVLKLFLENAGHTVTIAANVTQGKAALQAGGHDAVVLDLNMPDGRGFDVLRYLRGELKSSVKVIVLSGQKQEAAVLQALELGADDFVRKPFSPREVAARLTRLVR
jgi:DNA-binding response OmpR family regulator